MERFKPKLRPIHAGVAAGVLAGMGAAFILGQAPSAQSAFRQPTSPSPSVSPSTTATPSSSPTQASSPTRNVYTATLTPINANSAAGIGSANGAVRIVVDGNRIGVDLQGSGFDPGAQITAGIRTGTSCPTTAANDTNGDGFVDATEAAPTWGTVLVPFSLAADLSVTGQGIGFVSSTYPIANSTDGALNYINAGPFGAISSALQRLSSTATSTSTPTPTPSVSVTVSPTSGPSILPSPTSTSTGAAGQASNSYESLQGYVIGVQGVGTSASLPSSVAAGTGASAETTLPVACGTITQITE
jgi:hypothetical protein